MIWSDWPREGLDERESGMEPSDWVAGDGEEAGDERASAMDGCG